MFTPLPGSSEQTLRRDASVEVSAAVSEKLAALAIDEPLSDDYRSDRVSLLVQSPSRIYLYWNFASDPFATLRKAFGAQADAYGVAVRLMDLDSGEEVTYEASPFAGNFWFNVRPGKSYRASVGLMATGRPFLKLLASQIVRTPRTSPSPHADATPEFRIPAIEFARALNESGFTQAAIEVGLEEAGAPGSESKVAALTEEWARVETGFLTDEELSELRALLAAIAAGADIEKLRANLSPRLADILDRILATVDAARLRGLLGEALGFEIEPVDGTTVLLGPVWGASDVHFPQRTFRVTTKTTPTTVLYAPSSHTNLKL
ncbi:MAG: DUF4912 domain-containing protein [Pyrinomonadaceae bacterium]